jgi:hypothetical protein
MKKLMTILVVFALCGTVMAATIGPDLESGKYKYEKGVYTKINESTNHSWWHWGSSTPSDPYTSPLTMNYTRVGSHIGQAYFTTMSEQYLSQIKDDNGNPMTKVVVQFLGTEIDDTRPELGHDVENIQGTITDYGIYLYDKNQTVDDIKKNLMSVSKGNSFALDPGQDFGIYYTDSTGREWYSTINYVGTYDPDKHYINYYDENGVKILAGDDGNGVMDDEGNVYSDLVDIRYTCAFMTKQFGDHWEFMLETKLDHPYYNVDPKDFEGNGDTFNTTGQPLPGTLATLLIGGLCAGSLRKRNKK